MTETAENNTFAFDLVSPEKKLVSEPAKMVVVPGEQGDFGVLPKHSALVSSIRPGILTVHGNDNEKPTRIFVAGGFADVTPSSCTVLAEEAVMVDDLDREELEKTLENLTEDLAMTEEEHDKGRIMQKIKITKAKLCVVRGEVIAV